MSAYRKVNGEMIPVTTEGHPQYYFDTLSQAEAALSQLEEGADVFVEEGSNERLFDMLHPIGTIIETTTCDTMAKVIATYGGKTWIQHSGYVLRGATSGVVANSATKTGGSDDAIVVSHNHTFTGTAVTSGNNSANPTVSGGSCTISSSGGHTHTITSYYVSDTVNTGSYQRMATSTNHSDSRTNAATIASNTGTHTHTVPDHAHTVSGTHTHSVTASGTISTEGSSGTNANIPNYKSVYIWERTA